MLSIFNDPKRMKLIDEKYGSYFKERHILFEEGEEAKSFYILREGYVKIFRRNLSEKVTLNIIRPNEIFGELALLSNNKRSTSAVTLSEGYLVTLDEKILYRLMETDKNFVMSLMKEITRRIRTLSMMVKDFSVGNNKNIITSHIVSFVNMHFYGGQSTTSVKLAELEKYIYKETGIKSNELQKVLTTLQKENLIMLDKNRLYVVDKKLFLKAIPRYF